MKIGFVYDVQENVFHSHRRSNIEELTTELFSASQANALISALKQLGHEIVVIDGAENFAAEIIQHRKDIQFIFNEAKGLFGPDRKMVVPALCRIYGIPCLGSDAYAVTLSRNKLHTLAVASFAGVTVPSSLLIDKTDLEQIVCWEKYPAIVKPNFESSSIGISDSSIVRDAKSLELQVCSIIENYNQPALVQEFVPGTELQVSFLGNKEPRAIGAMELLVRDGCGSPRDFIRNQDWREGNVEFKHCDDLLLLARARELGARLYRHLGIRDYGRLDFRCTPSGALFFIESATHPHITPGASYTVAAEQAGLTFTGMIEALLEAALARHSRPEEAEGHSCMQ